MNQSQLLALTDQAFAAGQANRGLALLRQYNASNNTDAGSWHRQANIEEQIGDVSCAGEAHFRCIEIAPHNPLAYLYAGYWLQKKKQQSTAAAALYSLAFDLDPSTLTLWKHPNCKPETYTRSFEADKTMRYFFSEQHRRTCTKLKGAQRIKKAQWIQTRDQVSPFPIESFSPELFFIPELSSKPFYPSKELEWAEQLNRSSNKIKQELNQAMLLQLTQNNIRPYLSESFLNHLGLSELANSSNWSAIDLFKNGELNSEISALFPETLKALNKLPTYNLRENPFEVFFSFLKPHQSIAPHFGQSNHALTVHLPLSIPASCFIEVGTQKQSWHEGEALIFDDSFLHSAHNKSDETRIVLIFSIWHPELTEDERNAVQESFNARQKLISERHLHLQSLRST